MTSKAKKRFLFFGILTGVISACLGLETQHSNHLGWALLFSGATFTTSGCLYLGALSMQASGKQSLHDRSLWLPCLGVLTISLVTPMEYLFLPPVLPRSDHNQDIGLILFVGGLVFYLISLDSAEPWKFPGRRFTFKAFRSLDMFMRLIRCPISASLLLIVFGLGIGYSSWIGLVAIFVLVLPGLVKWMRAIDRQVHRFG